MNLYVVTVMKNIGKEESVEDRERSSRLTRDFERPFTFDRVVRIIIGLVVLFLLYLLVDRLSSVLLPFVIAWLLAYLMNPLTVFFQRRCRVRNRAVAIFLTFLSILLLLSLVLLTVLPPLTNEIKSMSGHIATYAEQLQQSEYLPSAVKSELGDWLSAENVQSFIAANQNSISGLIHSLSDKGLTLLSSSFDFIVKLFVVFVVFLYTVFILLDYNDVTNGFMRMVPIRYRGVLSMIMQDLEDGMNRYFRGQALIALIVGVLLAFGFWLIGLPLGILLGLLMGALTLIPYMKLVMLPVVGFFAFVGTQQTGMSYWPYLLEVLAITGVVQVLEDLFLIPKIMGKRMGLNPALILLSLSVWGALLGVVGMIMALPLTTLIISYYKRYILVGLNQMESEEKQAEATLSKTHPAEDVHVEKEE